MLSLRVPRNFPQALKELELPVTMTNIFEPLPPPVAENVDPSDVRLLIELIRWSRANLECAIDEDDDSSNSSAASSDICSDDCYSAIDDAVAEEEEEEKEVTETTTLV